MDRCPGEASSNYNATSRLSEIKAPTLIMHGKSDKVAPLAIAEELHQGIKGSQLEAFNGGHIFFLIRGRQKSLESIASWLGT